MLWWSGVPQHALGEGLGGNCAVGNAARGGAQEGHPCACAGTRLPGQRVMTVPRGLCAGRVAWYRGHKVPEDSPAPFLPCERGSERLFISVTLLHKPQLPTDGSKWAR